MYIPLEWSEALPCSSGSTGRGCNGHPNLNVNSVSVVFSPLGNLVASAVDGNTIIIRDVESLSVTACLQVADVPSCIEFSPTGSCILVCIPKRSCVSVFPVTKMHELSDTSAGDVTLTETLAGVVFATWVKGCPTKALIVSDFGCRMILWDVAQDDANDALNLACPKVPSRLGVASSPDGSLLAVLARRGCRDKIVLYDGKTFKELANLELDTVDAAGMIWSPNSKNIAVWDSMVYDPKVVVIGVADAVHNCACNTPNRLSIPFNKKWSSKSSGLGVRTTAWSPSGSVLVVGTYDADVYVVNGLTWRSMDSMLHHGNVVDVKKYGNDVEVFEEAVMEDGLTAQYVEENLPVRLSGIDSSQPNQMGIDRLCFSSSGRFIASIHKDKPHVLWLWDASTFALNTVLVHKRPIRDMVWQPDHCQSDTLYLVCGNKCLYAWDDGMVSCISTGIQDEKFKGQSLLWSKKALALSSPLSFAIGFNRSQVAV
jgi:WD40 repeat protein